MKKTLRKLIRTIDCLNLLSLANVIMWISIIAANLMIKCGFDRFGENATIMRNLVAIELVLSMVISTICLITSVAEHIIEKIEQNKEEEITHE